MRERVVGSLLGLALGDALGAAHEGGLAARGVWWMLGLTRPGVLRWTDDTLMALGLTESLAEHGDVDADALASRWARDARWSRGYGPAALKTLARIRRGMPWTEAACSVYPEGSFGNGAAMRAAPIGLFHDDAARRRDAARRSAAITHAHPLGIEGAVIMAEAAHQALHGPVRIEELCALSKEPAMRAGLERAEAMRASGEATPEDVARTLGNGMRAQESVPTALYVHLRHDASSFDDVITFVRRVGGDTDTIGAMAGALHGARHGARSLPQRHLERLESVDALRAAAENLHAARGEASA